MRVLLRHSSSGLLYAGPNQWTPHASEAIDFRATDRALDQLESMGDGEMEVLMQFEEPAFEIPLAVVAPLAR